MNILPEMMNYDFLLLDTPARQNIFTESKSNQIFHSGQDCHMAVTFLFKVWRPSGARVFVLDTIARATYNKGVRWDGDDLG